MDFIDISLWFGYFLIAIAALGSIVLPLINSMDDPKSLLKPVAGVVSMIIVFLLGYLLSGNEVTALYTKHGVGATASQMIGGALTMMYIMILGAFIGIIYTEIAKIIK
jgi:hypothetical protein